MANLPDLIREYRAVVQQEQQLAARKLALRDGILIELTALKREFFVSPYGTAACRKRFNLLPRPEAILNTLSAQDLLPFAHFTPKRVKELLVPKYGRERLVPLFDIESTPYVIVRPPAEKPF